MCAICVKKSAAARYVRLPKNRPGCPASGCPELCPAARLPGILGCLVCPAARNYVRLPGMSGCPKCPVCPAARYVRLPGNMPGCPICPAVRLPGTMPGCPEICPELCPECPAPRHRHYSYAWTPNAGPHLRRWQACEAPQLGGTRRTT